MPQYAAKIDGKRFEVDINDTATEVRFNGEVLNFDSVWLAGSRQNITFVVAQADLATAVQRLHYRFFEASERAAQPAAAPDSKEPAL